MIVYGHLLTEDELEYYEERAGILEYCAGMSRQGAERQAMRDLTAYRAKKRADEQDGKSENTGPGTLPVGTFR